MTYTESKKYLKRAIKNGYMPYYNGIAHMITGINNGKEQGYYGINIDGNGHDGRYFGCPILIWDSQAAEEKFPARIY